MILFFGRCVSGFTSRGPIFPLRTVPEEFTFTSLSGFPNGKNWRGFRRYAKAGSNA
jgi:hypothetical protein